MSSDSRLIGRSSTEEIRPEVSLVSYTSCPVGTLFSIWHGSRHREEVSATIAEFLYRCDADNFSNIHDQELRDDIISTTNYIINSYPEYCPEVGTLFDKVHQIITQVAKLAIKVDTQASEFVSYEFEVDKASVAWREQLVRKRQLHIWTQTSRVADMTTFDSTMMPTVKLMGGNEAADIYKDTVSTIREAYKNLAELGVPLEDIRLQPQSHIHRVYFGGSLRSILKLVEDRTSWIAQATLWAPVVSEIVRSLRITLGNWIIDLLKPPARVSLIDGKYQITDYKLLSDDQARYEGHDPLPVSPIFLAYKGLRNNYQNREFYDYMKSMYINIWPREILEAIDWDEDNPLKPGKYDVGYEGCE